MKALPKFDNKLVIKIYELAKSGLADPSIAQCLNIKPWIFQRWIRDHAQVGHALEEARKILHDKKFTFKDYVYGKLSSSVQAVWNRLVELEGEPGSAERCHQILASNGRRVRQQLFFYALVHFNFNASEACRFVGINKATLGMWIVKYPQFRQLMDEIHWHKGNFFEGALVNLVANGDTGATIFANKTFNKNRGYSEKVEVQVSGEVKHTLSLEKLPLELRRQLLEHARATQLEDKSQILDAEVVKKQEVA